MLSEMLRAGHGLILAVIGLLTFGVVMVNSAGLGIGGDRGIEIRDVLLGRHVLLAGLALGMLGLGSTIRMDRVYLMRGVRSPILWVALAAFALLGLVYVPMIGHEVNGALRWLKVGPLTFQPSEFAKWGVLLVLAWHAARRAGAMGHTWSGFVPPMILVGGLCVLIALEDLGTAVLIFGVCVMVLWAAGCRWWQVGSLIPFGAAGFVAAVIHSPYRIERLRSYMDPYADPQGIGYHVIQSMASVSGGGLTGRGLGNSIHKFGYLPESTTDFIFAIICEELGVFGALMVVALYAVLLLSGLAVVRRLAHPFPKVFCLGVLLMIAGQALMNIAVVTGSVPAKGIALPLVSSGGSGWLLTSFAIGMMVSIDRHLAKESSEVETDCEAGAADRARFGRDEARDGADSELDHASGSAELQPG